MVKVLYTILEAKKHQELFRQHLTTFPISFQEKLLKFRRWQDAQASLLGRLLLKEGLLSQFDKILDYNTLGYTELAKPYLKNSPIHFNISHSKNLVVCAIGVDIVFGIDVEYHKNIDIREFKFQMTDGEWQLIASAAQPAMAFYDYWTRKEAIIKAEGKGFSMDLKSFEVLSCEHPIAVEEKMWYLTPIEIHPNYTTHLASDKPISVPTLPQKVVFL
ncbi:MAG: 4'-phosphopantetheinyl transferase superfamily protein [Bacteroidota bacterium]